MIHINYKGKWNDLYLATAKANELLNDKAFLNIIRARTNFDSTEITGSKIVELIQKSNLEMYVLTYRSLLRTVYGYEDPNNPDLIHINLWRNEWNVPSLVNTIIHECMHGLDSLYLEYEFGHGNNSSTGKENTVPYWIGNRAEQFINGNDKPVAILEFEVSPEEAFFV